MNSSGCWAAGIKPMSAHHLKLVLLNWQVKKLNPATGFILPRCFFSPQHYTLFRLFPLTRFLQHRFSFCGSLEKDAHSLGECDARGCMKKLSSPSSCLCLCQRVTLTSCEEEEHHGCWFLLGFSQRRLKGNFFCFLKEIRKSTYLWGDFKTKQICFLSDQSWFLLHFCSQLQSLSPPSKWG